MACNTQASSRHTVTMAPLVVEAVVVTLSLSSFLVYTSKYSWGAFDSTKTWDRHDAGNSLWKGPIASVVLAKRYSYPEKDCMPLGVGHQGTSCYNIV